jgi:hypothetical protein
VCSGYGEITPTSHKTYASFNTFLSSLPENELLSMYHLEISVSRLTIATTIRNRELISVNGSFFNKEYIWKEK